MESLEFTDPPKDGRGGEYVSTIRSALMERPAQWAKIPRSFRTTAAAYQMRRRLGDAFEVTIRVQPDGSFAAWARYVGEDS